MIRRLVNALRAYLGGFALVLGCVGLFVFVLAIPFTIFGAHFWGGFGFREGPQPSPAELDATVSRTLDWTIQNRLVPLFVTSVVLIGYGFYEARAEQKSRTNR